MNGLGLNENSAGWAIEQMKAGKRVRRAGWGRMVYMMMLQPQPEGPHNMRWTLTFNRAPGSLEENAYLMPAFVKVSPAPHMDALQVAFSGFSGEDLESSNWGLFDLDDPKACEMGALLVNGMGSWNSKTERQRLDLVEAAMRVRSRTQGAEYQRINASTMSGSSAGPDVCAMKAEDK